MYAGQNNEHDYLDYGYASLDWLVSLNRLSVGCETTPRRQTGDLTAFECYPCEVNNAATSRIMANRARDSDLINNYTFIFCIILC